LFFHIAIANVAIIVLVVEIIECFLARNHIHQLENILNDFRAFASIVKGRKKADNITAWLVPGSWMVDEQIRQEGLDKVLEEAGFEIRQPGCSACLAMNDDKIPAGKYSVSTSNRNFEGRQGPGSRTLLASPLTAAAAAVTGVITDPRTLM
jgi:3-isopropylmalate/(R)-2-methylmalate dehydratase large subunit